MTTAVHVMGAVALDMIYRVDRLPGHDEKAFAIAVEPSPGGPATFVALAIAALGGRPHLHAILGADPAGDQLCAALVKHGVDLTHTARRPGIATSHTIIILDRTGEKSIVIVPIPETALADCGSDAVYESSATLVTQLLHPEAVERAILAVRRAGGRTLVDMEAPDMERWSWERVFQAVALADFVCANGQLLRARKGSAELNHAAALASELAAGRRGACVTLGARGVVLAHGDRRLHLAAIPLTPKNTTGAGDTFIAALSVALATGLDIEPSVAFAAFAAARFLEQKELGFDGIARGARRLTFTNLASRG